MSIAQIDQHSTSASNREVELQRIREAFACGQKAFSEPDAKRILAAFGLTVPRGVVFENLSAGGDVCAKLAPLEGPLVAKIVSPYAIHKSDIGGVALRLFGEVEVKEALARLAENGRGAGVAISGYLVEEMAPAGRELVIGGMHDPRFGPVIMFGLGGVHIEVFKDVAFRVCPITHADAVSMIDELQASPLLRGIRGQEAVDEDRLVDALLRIGGADGLLIRSAGGIEELDINPLMASAEGLIACDARITLRWPNASSACQASRRNASELLDRFRPLFEPKVIAVLGASASGSTLANEFIRQSRALGCKARIVPVHPTATEVEALPAVSSIAEIGEMVDYAYVSIAAQRVPAMLTQAMGKVRYAQVISSGFGEVEDGRDLESQLATAGRNAGIRVLGPNCLGTYSPRAGMTFIGDSSREPGTIGVVSQSGGLAVDMLLRGRVRGLRFSGLVTLGNSVDVGPAELVEYYLADPQTHAVGIYAEDIKDGRRFFEALRNVVRPKPVVVLLGGQTNQGQAAAASHTGSLASPLALWRGMAAQTGLVLVETLEEFLDTLLAFQALQPRSDRPTQRCVLFGNGGGTSVLAADALGRRGLEISRLPPHAIAQLSALQLPPGTSVVNPIDAPANTLRQDDGRIAEAILDVVASAGESDAVLVHVNLPVFIKSTNQDVDVLGNLMAALHRVRQRHANGPHFLLVLRSDGTAECDERKREFRSQAIAAGIPAFHEMSNAANALAAVAAYERFLATKGPLGS